jgi:uncharacterized Zn finger protein (UPF0148 family)
MRRNLPGTIKTGEQALLAIDTILKALCPKCKSCLFEHGLVRECRCQKSDNANGSLKGSVEKVLDQKQARLLYQTGIEASVQFNPAEGKGVSC